MPDLLEKRARFVEEYLVDLNATQAAIRAGYSAKTAHSQGPRLLDNVAVKAAIAEAQVKRAARTEITADRVLRELARVGFTNLSDVSEWGEREVAIGYDADGKRLSPADIGDAAVVHHEMAPFLSLIDSGALAPDHRAAVSEVALTKDGFKIKLHDKVGALQQIGRHLGMFTDKIEVTASEELAVRMQAARERARGES